MSLIKNCLQLKINVTSKQVIFLLKTLCFLLIDMRESKNEKRDVLES